MLPELAATLRAALRRPAQARHPGDGAATAAACARGPGAIAGGAASATTAAAIPDGEAATCCSPPRACCRRWSRASRGSPATCGVMVNVSDIYAMGGRPLAVVDALFAPRRGGGGAAAGWASPTAAAQFGVPVVGGHTNLQRARSRSWRSRCWAARAACSPASMRARATSWSPPSTCAARCTGATRSGTPASPRRRRACAPTTNCCRGIAEAGLCAACQGHQHGRRSSARR